MTPRWPLPFWIAHRGAGKLAPENTLAAFRLGAAHGYRAFECDVKLSADGLPFLLHDATLERTSNGQGPAGQRPWSALSRLDAGGWHSRAYAGEPLPSLEAIAHYVRRNGFALNIEIKPSPGTEYATGLAVGRACLGLWPGAAEPLLFSSFAPEALRGAREAAPGLPRALLLQELTPGWLEQAQALGCIAVVTHHAAVDTAALQQAHTTGLRVVCYTVNDPLVAQRLQALGVDGLITDAVDVFVPAAGVPA